MSKDKRPSEVLPFLLIGDRTHAKSRGLLTELKVKRVLNVTPPRTVDPNAGCPNFFEKEGAQSILYRRVPIMDNRGEDLLSHLESSIAFIKAGQYHGRVLVHCHKGVSRSASIVLAYLMKEEGMSLSEAMVFLKTRRPCINPHEAFMSQLAQFERQLKEKRDKESTTCATKSSKATEKERAVSIQSIGPCLGPFLKSSQSPQRESESRKLGFGPMLPPCFNDSKIGESNLDESHDSKLHKSCDLNVSESHDSNELHESHDSKSSKYHVSKLYECHDSNLSASHDFELAERIVTTSQKLHLAELNSSSLGDPSGLSVIQSLPKSLNSTISESTEESYFLNCGKRNASFEAVESAAKRSKNAELQ